MNDLIPTIIKELAKKMGYNSVSYLGELDGSSVFGGGFIGKDGLPCPTGLPTLILLKDSKTKIVYGEEALELLGHLFPDDTDDAMEEEANLMPSEKHTLKTPIFAIDRLRMGKDGPGITTLVCFMGCPLKCAYCLNERCHEPIYENDHTRLKPWVEMLTPQELYDRVKIDNLYFQATGGGICFGGGEPTLYKDFILEFSKLCEKRWKITLETSLACPDEVIEELAPIVDLWIVDIKDLDDATYQAYTGKERRIIPSLLKLSTLQLNDKVIVKVPLIPGYNDEASVVKNINELESMGFKQVMPIRYVKRIPQ